MEQLKLFNIEVRELISGETKTCRSCNTEKAIDDFPFFSTIDAGRKNTLIESLPDNFIVRGYLDLRHTPIKSLPDNLKVGKDLGIQFTEIKTLPDSLFVKNKIYIYFTPLNDNDELVKEYMKYYDFDRYRP